MLDERGLSLAHPRQEWMLQADAGQLVAPIMERVRAGQTEFDLTFEGKRKVYTVARFSSERFNVLHSWYIVSCRDYDEVISAVTFKFRRLLTCMAVVGAVVIMIIMALTRRLVSRPLAALTRSAERVAAGNLQTDWAGAARRDEIGVLGQAFGRMTASLQDQTRLIRQSADMLEQAASRITNICREQEETVQANKTTTAEVAASVHQISATAHELANTMQNVREMSASTAAHADAGQASLKQLASTMERLLQATSGISQRLSAINSKATSINSVITTITKVADQTNLLSLNAAIEAEKAGAYGVGFAVVAREIRRLADQTAIATLDIERIIRDMQEAVDAGVREMDIFVREVKSGTQVAGETGNRLGATIAQVQAMGPRFEQVNNGMREQSQGAAEISQAMGQISDKAVQTTAGLAQIVAAVQDLRAAAAELQRQVARFTMYPSPFRGNPTVAWHSYSRPSLPTHDHAESTGYAFSTDHLVRPIHQRTGRAQTRIKN